MPTLHAIEPTTSPLPSSAHRFLPVLLLLFIGSGCSALIYEIVWFQLLQLVIGSSAVSLGILLGTFMGGMCLGSLLLPRMIGAGRHPLRVYAALETGIGAMGILVLFGMPLVDRAYVAYVGHGFAGILLRGAVCAVCLLPPTLLMGATLPAIARWTETTPRGVGWLGFFYGGNIAGAVFGCLLAGFYLLRIYDMQTATYVAAAINGSVAIIGLVLASFSPHQIARQKQTPADAIRAPHAWSVYIAIALSGLSALGAEVVWTRLLSLLFGASVYTFSIILAVFLIGLGIGSTVGAFLARQIARPRLALGLCQVFLTGAVAWTAWNIAQSLPYWPINPELSTNVWFNFQLDLMRCLWAVLPAACLWGASFPLALAAVASRGQEPGRMVGGVYAANTVGAIIGALAFAMLVIPQLGTQQAQRILIGIGAMSALIVLAPMLWPTGSEVWHGITTGRLASRTASVTLLLAAIVIAALLARGVKPVPSELIAYGRYLPTYIGESAVVYCGEGMNSSVAVTETFSGIRQFHVSGKVEASSQPMDMRLQRMLGHIPALVHPNPRSVLVVGCGAGVTAGSFTVHPGIQRIVICEIEPLIPAEIAKKYFAIENYFVLEDPRVEVVLDDARHYILTTHEKFDIITSDPINPWVKGAATLYTKEYFELCKRHLNPGGAITQWLPLYEVTTDAVKGELRTFFEVFPCGTIWSNDSVGRGYDILLLAQVEPTRIDIDALRERLDRNDHLAVAESLHEVEFQSVFDLLARYAGRASDLQPWLKGAQINRDRNLRLQYLAGMGLNSYRSGEIFDEIVAYRRFPEDLFGGSEASRRGLEKAMGKNTGRNQSKKK